MNQVVAATFLSVPLPFCATVRDVPAPPVVDPAMNRESVVIAIVILPAKRLSNGMTVPIGNGTDEFAGIVCVRPVAFERKKDQG